MIRLPPSTTRTDTLFPYTTLFRSCTRISRLVGGTLDLSRQLLAPPPRGCTAVPASSRPHPKFIVVAAHFEGARRLRGRFPGAWETLYGRLCPVPYEILALQQQHEDRKSVV